MSRAGRWTLAVVLVGAAVVAAVALSPWGGGLGGLGQWTRQGAQAATGASGQPVGTSTSAAAVLEFLPSEVVLPEWASMPARLEFSGPLVAPQAAVVHAKLAGTLVSLEVREGSRVRAGQVIGRIDAADAASRVSERSALLDSARAALSQAERAHGQNESLAQQRFISPLALESSRATLDTARAQVAAAQAALNTSKLSLVEATVVAPIGGLVARRHALPGEKVGVEQQLVSIVDIAELELAATVGTHEVGRLAAGMKVAVVVEGVAEPREGRILRIAPAAEPGTRAIGVTVGLANPQEVLRAGQYAVARLTLADDTRRLTLPEAAVSAAAGQSQVWVLAGGVLGRRVVTLGRRDPASARVEVLEGLKPEDRTLAARFDNLREGGRAVIVAARPAASAAASAAPAVPAAAAR